jgi:L-fuconolactonase
VTAGAVDAHVHLWDLDRMALPWFHSGLGLPEVAGVRALGAAAALAVTPAGSIDAVVAVQAADTRGEALWLTGLADPLLAGVVLQYDPADPAGGAHRVPGARGVRVAVPDRRADLSDVAGLDDLCDAMAATQGVVEFLVRAEQLPAVAAVAARHPGTPIVLCHLGLGSGEPGPAWADALAALAAQPRVAAKASGIVTAGGDARLRRALRVAVDAFGAGRLLFGSDWPMSARVAPYAEVVARTAAALPPLGAAGDAAFWGGTARALYALGV